MALDETVVAAVGNENFKTVGGFPASMANLALSNAVAHQQAMNAITLSLTAKACELLVSTDVAEAAGLTPLAQQAAKVAQTTPPVTP